VGGGYEDNRAGEQNEQRVWQKGQTKAGKGKTMESAQICKKRNVWRRASTRETAMGGGRKKRAGNAVIPRRGFRVSGNNNGRWTQRKDEGGLSPRPT